MKRHTRIYFDFFGYDENSYIPCEVCGVKAVDIHHIQARGLGGNPKGDKDNIENLVALCRKDHEKYGDKKIFKDWLRNVHRMTMEQHLNKVSTK